MTWRLARALAPLGGDIAVQLHYRVPRGDGFAEEELHEPAPHWLNPT